MNWRKHLNWDRAFAGVALLVAVYFGIESTKSPEPVFRLGTERARIVEAGRLVDTQIRVFKRDSLEVTRDLNVVQFWFFNEGEVSVRRGDMVRPITVTVEDTSAEILDARIVARTKYLNQASLVPVGRAAIQIDFDLLPQDQGLRGQLIYEGNPDAAIGVRGYIDGAGETTLATSKKSRSWLTWAGLSLVVLLVNIPALRQVIRDSRDLPSGASTIDYLRTPLAPLALGSLVVSAAILAITVYEYQTRLPAGL